MLGRGVKCGKSLLSSGDVAPMEPHHPLRPMKSLAPPGLIAAGALVSTYPHEYLMNYIMKII
jgi:hypothetical protein